MVPEIVKPLAASVASALFGVGAWVLAQESAISDGLNLVGGSILVASAIVALRMILRAAAHERDAATATETRLAKLVGDLEHQLDEERQRSARLLVAYDRERHLRIGLEAAGLTDRRRNGSGEELVYPKDYRDLGPSITEAGENLEGGPGPL